MEEVGFSALIFGQKNLFRDDKIFEYINCQSVSMYTASSSSMRRLGRRMSKPFHSIKRHALSEL